MLLHDLNLPSLNFAFQGEVNAIKWDPAGSLLASCSDDYTAKVIDYELSRWYFGDCLYILHLMLQMLVTFLTRKSLQHKCHYFLALKTQIYVGTDMEHETGQVLA